MIHFCVILAFLLHVLETAAGLLPEHVKVPMHWSVSHCVNTHSNSKAPSKTKQRPSKNISSSQWLNLNILALRLPWIPVSLE